VRHEHFERESPSTSVYKYFLLVFFLVDVVIAMFLGPRSQDKDVGEKFVWKRVDGGPLRRRDKRMFPFGGLPLKTLDMFGYGEIGKLEHPNFLAVYID
jgi:hypothetical protein